MAISALQNIERGKGAAAERKEILAEIRDLLRTYATAPEETRYAMRLVAKIIRERGK